MLMVRKVESPFVDVAEMVDSEQFGYQITIEQNLVPVLFVPPYRPLDVPEHCNSCTSCVRVTCPCRLNNSACSDYCKCGDW